MGLQSALSTALTGMTAAETTIDVVGNNVANSNTIGFKASDAVFATQFLQTQSLGSQPTGNRGGTNPRQIGLGTKVAEITPDFTQGTIEVSSNPLDVAVQGDGFFIVEGQQGQQLYTRNGQFKTNAENQITTTTGQRVLGFGVNENFEIQTTELTALTIPLGAEAVAQATQNVFLEGTLIPNGESATTPGIIESAVLSDGSFEIPPDLTLGDVAAITQPATTGSSLALGGAGGLTAGTYRYRYTAVDAFGSESPISDDVANIVSAGGDSVDVTLPAVPAGYASFNVYRTEAGGTEFFLAGNDPGGGVFNDAVDDATLATNQGVPDTLVPGNYSYYVTFVNSGTGLESRPTSLAGPVSVSVTDRRIRLQNLPQPTTAEFDSVRVYRSLSDNDDTFYEIATLAGGETTYIDGASDASIADPNKAINLDGPAINAGLALLDVVRRDGSTYENVFQEGTLSFTGRKGGRQLSTKELTIDSTTTIQDLVDFMEDSMGIQETDEGGNSLPGSPGGSINSTESRLRFTSNLGNDNSLDISLAAFELETTSGDIEGLTLPFSTTQEADGESAVTDFVVYDTLGFPLNVRLTVVVESTTSASSTYRWFANSSDNDPISGVDTTVGTGTITFNSEGNVVAGGETTVSIDRRNVPSASPLEFELDFSELSGLAGDNSEIAASRQDGSGAGVLASFIVTESGAIRGVFTNGATRSLGQMRMARFANNAGLEQIGDNLFAEGINSGLPVLGNPGERGIGQVSAGAVELSNTDIGQNLIALILASTQYRGGTRVITAVQQLFDELLAIRR